MATIVPRAALVGSFAFWNFKREQHASQTGIVGWLTKSYQYSSHEMIIFEGYQAREVFFGPIRKVLRIFVALGYGLSILWIKFCCPTPIDKFAGYLLILFMTGCIAAYEIIMRSIVTNVKFYPEDMSVELASEFTLWDRRFRYYIRDLEALKSDDDTIMFKLKRSTGLGGKFAILEPKDYLPHCSVKYENKDLLIDLVTGNVDDVKKYKFVPK